MPTPSMQINPRLEDERAAFEADAAPMGFDLKRLSCLAPEPWSEYADESTGHRWGGWHARATSTRESCPLTIAQIHDCARDAQIDFCMNKESSFEVAFARRIEKARAALNGADAGVSEGWQDIARAPEGVLLVVGWLNPEDAERPERHDFDYLEDGVWQKHSENVEYFQMCAPPGSRGPSEQAPYTHFMRIAPLPSAPTQGGSHGK